MPPKFCTLRCSFHPISISVQQFIFIFIKWFSVPPAALQLGSGNLLHHFPAEKVTGKVLFSIDCIEQQVFYLLFSWEGALTSDCLPHKHHWSSWGWMSKNLSGFPVNWFSWTFLQKFKHDKKYILSLTSPELAKNYWKPFFFFSKKAETWT